MSKTTVPATTKEEFLLPAISNNGDIAAYREELEGLTADLFTKVKIPSGGGLAFTIPVDENDPEVEKEIVGVIVDHHPINAYWQTKFDGQNNPPECASMDAKRGEGIPGGACATCKMNEFGSGEGGRGKACKNMHRVYILRGGEELPILLTLPPTSLKPFGGFLSRQVIAKGRRSFGVVTKIALKPNVSGDGIKYSQAVFSIAEILSPEQVAHMKNYSAGIKPLTRQLAIESDAYEISDSDSDDLY